MGCPLGRGVTLCKVCPCNQRPFSVRLADDIPSSLGMEMLSLESGPGWGATVSIAGWWTPGPIGSSGSVSTPNKDVIKHFPRISLSQIFIAIGKRTTVSLHFVWVFFFCNSHAVNKSIHYLSECKGSQTSDLGLWPSLTEWIPSWVFNSRILSQGAGGTLSKFWITEIEVIELEGFIMNHQRQAPRF